MKNSRIFKLLERLQKSEDGVAYIELAYMTPILLALGLGGIELTNYAITHTRVSQLSLTLADNASRAKQDVPSGAPRFREADVQEIFTGLNLQAGNLNFKRNGRAILSSLEVNAQNGQWIHWQRCYGDKTYPSTYGREGDGATGTSVTGMGPTGNQVAAEQNAGIMFVQIFYDYQPIIFGQLIPDKRIEKTAALYVRDRRDYARGVEPTTGVTPATCPPPSP